MDRTTSATSALSRYESFQYPNSHLHHLSENQQSALEDFRALAEKEGYYKPTSADGHTTASHDDATLLRYLRARKFSPKDAIVQFRDTENWRKENHLRDLYHSIDAKEYEDTRRLYPQWTGRRDKRGIPLYLFQVSGLDSKTVAAYEKSISKSITVPHDEKKVPTKMLRLFALYENLMNFTMPLCSMMQDRPNAETPVTQTSNIVDISNVSLRQFWNLKNHMQDASQLATAYYPETLDRIFLIGAPPFFPTVWSWIKRWFDPITVSKIFILSKSEIKPTLEKYIDPVNIPKKYGGELDFEFGMMPIFEPAVQERLTWQNPEIQNEANTIPTGPLLWKDIDAPGVGQQLIAVGTNGGSPRDQVIATTSMQLPSASQSIDPLTNGIKNLGLQRTDTTEGTTTHPAEEGDLYYGADLKSESNSGSGTPNPASQSLTPNPPSTPAPPSEMKAGVGKTSSALNGASAVPAAAPAATTTATTEPITSGSSGKIGDQPGSGTSETKLDAQNETPAVGTPTVVDHGHGDRTVTTDTTTVGEAPKEKQIPSIQNEQPTLLDQAKAAAGAVYEQGVAVAGAVGLVKTEEQLQQEKKQEEKRKLDEAEQHRKDVDDPKVNEASNGKVEGF